jgi:hypothetical protein
LWKDPGPGSAAAPLPAPPPTPPAGRRRPTLQIGAHKFAASKFSAARDILANTIQGREYDDFLTTACYDSIVAIQPQARM